MTVVVETPEGLKTGSVVRQVTVNKEPEILGSSSVDIATKGEAVVVDLGFRGKLFVLNSYSSGGDSMAYVFWDAFPAPPSIGQGVTTPPGVRYYRSLKNKKAELPVDYSLLMVTFTDPLKPETATLVKAWGAGNSKSSEVNRLEDVFGQGVKIQKIVIETTTDPVTWSIEKHLPWIFANWPNTAGSPDTIHVSTPNQKTSFRLNQGLFVWRKKW